MPRSWIWNWQANVIAVNLEWQNDLNQANTLYSGLTSNYPGTIPNHLNFSGLEAIVISYYNGMAGGKIKQVPINGLSTSTCWWLNGDGTWTFLPNQQKENGQIVGYVDLVNGFVP